MGCGRACNKKGISNIEQGMSNAEAQWQRKTFVIQHSLFDIRYSFMVQRETIILELWPAGKLAKHLLILVPKHVENASEGKI
jgi:hypothetical protein